MRNLRKRMISAVLAVSVLAGSLIPCSAVNAYQDGDLKPGIYQQLDNVDRFSPGTPEDWVKSGNYYYEFLDSGKRYITIRKIEDAAVENGKLLVPKEIDGYPVLGIGTLYSGSPLETSDCCVMEHPEIVEELVLPEGLEYLGYSAFYLCNGLKKIEMPDTLVLISEYALVGSQEMNMDFVEFPYQIYIDCDAFGSYSWMYIEKAVVYSDSMIPFWYPAEAGFSITKELKICYHGKDSYRFCLPGSIKKIYVDNRIKNFTLHMHEDSDGGLLDSTIRELIINGKETKWIAYDEITQVGLEGGVRGLYTVKGAKAIKTARKFRVPYYWKKTGKTREVKGKKKNGKYKADWKKTATKVMKNTYDFPEEKWKTKPKTVKTEYRVYGKKKKNGTYKLLKTTTKTSIKSEYKYIKAVPVKTWAWK